MYVALIMLIIICGINGEKNEPSCFSTYDYEHKLLYKLIKIEEEVKTFRSFIDNMKNNQDKKEQEQEKRFETILSLFETAGEKQMDDLKAKSNTVLSDLEYLLSNSTATAEKWNNDSVHPGQTSPMGKRCKPCSDSSFRSCLIWAYTVCKKRNKTYTGVQAVGFSVNTPMETSISRQLTFKKVITNVGDGFDVVSGVFTCKIPGYYYFTASLLKEYSHTSDAYCYIRKNGDTLVRAYTYPGHTPKRGHYAAVNGVYVQMAAEDTVTLAECTTMSSIVSGIESSFSGFLVTPDVAY